MGGKRFPVGEIVAIVGTIAVMAGVSLIWFTLRIEAEGGKAATFALMGWEFTLGLAAAVAAGIGGVIALAGIFTSGTVKRILGAVVLLLGVAALAIAIIQVIDAPDVSAMNDEVGQAFDAAELDDYNARIAAWGELSTEVETGAGLWITLAGTALIVVGGGLAAALGGAKASSVAAPYAAAPSAAAPSAAASYVSTQPGYQQQAGVAAAPPPGVQAGYGPPVGPPVAAPAPAAPAPAAPAVAPGPAVAEATAPPPPDPAPAAPAAPVPVDAAITAEAPAAAPAWAAAPAKFCAKCGATFADETTRFCTSCGAPRAGAG